MACGNFVKGRSGKQCREHWNNCLNPDLIKGDWTEEEDFLIMFFYEKCKGSWKKIVPLFPDSSNDLGINADNSKKEKYFLGANNNNINKKINYHKCTS